MKTQVLLAALLSALLLSPSGIYAGRSGLAARGESPAAFGAAGGIGAPLEQDTDRVPALLQQLEQIVRSGNAAAYLDLLSGSADRSRARTFASQELLPGVSRAVIKERDRQPLMGTLPGNGYRLMVDVFIEYGFRARIATWQLDVRKVDEEWLLADQERLALLENIYRLSVNPAKQFDARAFTFSAEDLELTLAEGSVFTVDTDQGVTGLVLIGRGEMRFHPAPEIEKGQVKIFAGAETLESRFDAAYIRVGNFDAQVDGSRLVARPVDPRDLRQAEQVFREESPKNYTLDLGDLSRDTWSLLPGSGDIVAEVRTRRFDTLTYGRSTSNPDDISLFDRRRQRNIALYASRQKLATRGRFYNEDDFANYDVLDYDIELAVTPDRQGLNRQSIDGRARLRLKVQSPSIRQITLRLADALVVQSIVSNQFGWLFNLRVKDQNTVLVSLPVPVARGTEMELTVVYAGPLEPQTLDRETMALAQRRQETQRVFGEISVMALGPEPSYLYSNRSYWYPQAQITDYATATMRITVPAPLACVASGELSSESPTLIPGKDPSQAQKLYVFYAEQPVRYLSFLLSRFLRAERVAVTFEPTEGGNADGRARDIGPALTGAVWETLDLAIEANPLQLPRGRDLADRAVDVARFYKSILGDSPYPSFTLALLEDKLPGGHSPGYFAALNQPLPGTMFAWRNDPAVFDSYPEFFLAHEMAHQWWGQAVGWRNYHEQWLSEGFAQYFAALYAQHHRGGDVFASVMRHMRKWGMEQSDQGPVYLGYRLGHIRHDERIFRALVYNKGAAVLHMLRRLVGDAVFFRGMQRFYAESRFRKAGTENFRAAMEAEAGRSLERFFERWIYGSTLPRLKFAYRVERSAAAQEVVLHVEQVGDLFDVPITVTLQYADKKPVDVLVAVADRVVDVRVALTGTLRGVDISKDDGTLAEIVKN